MTLMMIEEQKWIFKLFYLSLVIFGTSSRMILCLLERYLDILTADPPGTAESQALIFSAPNCGVVNSSPVGVMDAPDQMLLPVGFPSFESFNPPSSVVVEECLSKTQDNLNTTAPLGQADHTRVSSSGEFDHKIKAEAIRTFFHENKKIRLQPNVQAEFKTMRRMTAAQIRSMFTVSVNRNIEPLGTYRKLPDAIIRKCETALEIQWPVIHLSEEEKQMVVERVETAVESVDSHIHNKSAEDEVNLSIELVL
ncbi:hypothetical protein K1719_038112 [Acacia pycnantha]|nr:hypothetical protein K1719_038112 [Acacia pycnantha]